MYVALWRILPGPRWIKVLELLIILSVVLLLLFQWVFPWANAYFDLTGNTVH